MFPVQSSWNPFLQSLLLGRFRPHRRRQCEEVRRAVSQQAGKEMMVSQREGAWVPSQQVREVTCTQLQTPCPPPRLQVSAVTAGDTYSDKYDFTMR